jgi:hypothetical protein
MCYATILLKHKPKVHPVNTYYNSYNYYVASTMNSRVGVASHDDSRYTTSTNIYSTKIFII